MEYDKERKISAGNYDLNKWLYGGYDKDIITTIYGPAGSGKTNFCMMAVVSQAKRGKNVIFIDTEGGFSIERFKQLCREDYQEALKSILLLKPTKFSEQQKIFSNLVREIKSKGNIGLIVVDGMTMLYRLECAEAGKEDCFDGVKKVNQELAKQMRILAEITRSFGIPVIVTNQGYFDFLSREDFMAGKKREFNMVGGDIMKYWSKCIIELENRSGRTRRAKIKKHRSLPEKSMGFIIDDRGIKKRGWI